MAIIIVTPTPLNFHNLSPSWKLVCQLQFVDRATNIIFLNLVSFKIKLIQYGVVPTSPLLHIG